MTLPSSGYIKISNIMSEMSISASTHNTLFALAHGTPIPLNLSNPSIIIDRIQTAPYSLSDWYSYNQYYTTTTTTIIYYYYYAGYYHCDNCGGVGESFEILSFTPYTIGSWYISGIDVINIIDEGGGGGDGDFSSMPGPYSTCILACASIGTTTTSSTSTTTTTSITCNSPTITNITLSDVSSVNIYFTGAPDTVPFEIYSEYNGGGGWSSGGDWAYPSSPLIVSVGGTPTGWYGFRLRNKCYSDYSAYSNEYWFNFGSISTTTTTAISTTTTTSPISTSTSTTPP